MAFTRAGIPREQNRPAALIGDRLVNGAINLGDNRVMDVTDRRSRIVGFLPKITRTKQRRIKWVNGFTD